MQFYSCEEAIKLSVDESDVFGKGDFLLSDFDCLPSAVFVHIKYIHPLIGFVYAVEKCSPIIGKKIETKKHINPLIQSIQNT